MNEHGQLGLGNDIKLLNPQNLFGTEYFNSPQKIISLSGKSIILPNNNNINNIYFNIEWNLKTHWIFPIKIKNKIKTILFLSYLERKTTIEERKRKQINPKYFLFLNNIPKEILFIIFQFLYL